MSVSCWWLSLCIAALFIAAKYFNRNWLASITLLYTLLSGVSVLALKRYPFAPIPIQQALMCTSLWGILSVLTVIIISEHLFKVFGEYWFNAGVYLLTLSNACLVIFNAIFFGVTYGNHGYTGFVLNASMNGCLIALGAGSAVKERAWAGLGIIILAVTLSLSSIPIGVLCVSLSAHLICMFRGKDILKWLVLVGAASLFCGLISSGSLLFDSAGRFEAYKIFMSEWWNRGMILFGTGLGTFQVMSPQMQAKHNFMMSMSGEGHYWPTMHSDWLQCLFELGVVGLVLYATLFCKTMRKLYEGEKHLAFSVLSGIAATAIFNYPFRYAVFGVIAVYTVRLAGTTTSRTRNSLA